MSGREEDIAAIEAAGLVVHHVAGPYYVVQLPPARDEGLGCAIKPDGHYDFGAALAVIKDGLEREERLLAGALTTTLQ